MKIKKSKYLYFVMILSFSLSSCNSEDGLGSGISDISLPAGFKIDIYSLDRVIIMDATAYFL